MLRVRNSTLIVIYWNSTVLKTTESVKQALSYLYTAAETTQQHTNCQPCPAVLWQSEIPQNYGTWAATDSTAVAFDGIVQLHSTQVSRSEATLTIWGRLRWARTLALMNGVYALWESPLVCGIDYWLRSYKWSMLSIPITSVWTSSLEKVLAYTWGSARCCGCLRLRVSV